MTIKYCYLCGIHPLGAKTLQFCSQECLDEFKESLEKKEKSIEEIVDENLEIAKGVKGIMKLSVHRGK